ncbi:MAG: stage V sporulation protein D [Clostridia bacterium]|nr:stage V sporulation protein D [Clostridia bacterium]
MKKRRRKKKLIKKSRMLTVALGFSTVFIILIGRLIYLIGFEGGVDYKLMALKRQTKTIEIAPQRGTIVDRNGSELAISLKVFRIDADLKILKEHIKKKNLSEATVTSDLANALEMELSEMEKIMNSTDAEGNPLQFVSLKRKVEKKVVDAVKALELKGIIVSDDVKRYYTNGPFLSHVLGHINMNGDPVTGVELSYNDVLTGIPGVKVVETDAINNSLPFTESIVIEPIDGKNVKLTIDERIQELSDRIAKETLEENSAKSVSITIMEPKTGEVLALTNYPSYDPNHPTEGGESQEEIQEMWKNRAVSNVFEPGSIFKVITAAASLYNDALEGGKEFYCEGSIKVAGVTIRCDNGRAHGHQDISDIIKNSCNVGFVQLGEKIGKGDLYNYIKLMGFGQKSGIDLPGETDGLVINLPNMGPVEAATTAYGQGVAVNQVQFMAAFNAIANGGTWIRPHVMKEVYHYRDGKKIVDKEFDKLGMRTVLSKEKAAAQREYMERVVSEGTSKATIVPGYSIGGKTGTASKVEDGRYVQGAYVSSFAGMAPVDDPKVTLIVTVVEPDPTKYYASLTAVPAAKKLFEELFIIMNIPPDKPEELIEAEEEEKGKSQQEVKKEEQESKATENKVETNNEGNSETNNNSQE